MAAITCSASELAQDLVHDEQRIGDGDVVGGVRREDVTAVEECGSACRVGGVGSRSKARREAISWPGSGNDSDGDITDCP